MVECVNCALRYTRPLPTKQELAKLYGQDFYVSNSPRLWSGDFLRILFQRSVFWQHHRALLGKRPGRALDLGCGNGDFLATLKRRGWEVYGTEFSSAACELARAKGVRVHQGDLVSANFPAQSFDVITLWHVFEHLPDPLAELAEVRRILRDDGLLVIEVPNSGCLTLRLSKQGWYPLDVPRHLQHYTPATLQRLLREAGFATAHQQNFHHWDFTYAFYSYMNRLKILERLGIGYFSTNYKQAALAQKALFLALGVPVALLCLPYSVIITLLSGNSETVTVTARKAAL